MNRIFCILIVFVLLIACSDEDEGDGNWSIPVEAVFDGGPGKDGIPSIDNPQFSSVAETDYLLDNDLVIGIKIGNEIRAYPHPILDWHEIINDQVGDNSFAITYCPLTGTAIGWNREIGGELTTFGVSGLLYNTNLIPYDRRTDSNWSQMLQESVNGSLIGEQPEFIFTVETTWSTWKSLYPNSSVVNRNTGFSRAYGNYPYGGYRTSSDLLFPVDNLDTRLSAKERVLGVDLGESQKAYRFTSFEERTIINDQVGGNDLIVVGDAQANFIVAFRNSLSGEQLPLVAVSDNEDIIMEDALGNRYNLFGEIEEGPNAEDALTPVNSYIGYWVAWAAFFPSIEIYEE